MFERYTEKARRTIFFARFEASQFGSPFIETEHLLLGLLREDRALRSHLPTDSETAIRTEITQRTPLREHVETSVDLPLSNDSKRVLAYAAEEAERLSHKHIGTEHLAIGLMRDQHTFAAQLLAVRGISLDGARKAAESAPMPTTAPIYGGHLVTGAQTVMIHGTRWGAQVVLQRAKELRRFSWIKQDWHPRDLLIEKQTGRVMFYLGQQYDEERFDLAKGKWPRDHCSICRWELKQGGEPEHAFGFSNGFDWLCTECYERFVAPHIDPGDDIYT